MHLIRNPGNWQGSPHKYGNTNHNRMKSGCIVKSSLQIEKINGKKRWQVIDKLSHSDEITLIVYWVGD